MAKLAQILFLILIVNVCTNDIIDLFRCVYQNFVPNIKVVFELIDLIKEQNWIMVVAKISEIYNLLKKIIPECKAKQAPSLL